MSDLKRDPEIVEAFLEAVGELGPREVERYVEGVSASDVSRWKARGARRLSNEKRRALLAYLKRAAADTIIEEAPLEESPEDAVAIDWPDVSFLEPEAKAEYDRILGDYLTRGWRPETIAAAARELTAFFRGENVLNQGGSSRRELSAEDQILVLRAEAATIERVYGPRGPEFRR